MTIPRFRSEINPQLIVSQMFVEVYYGRGICNNGFVRTHNSTAFLRLCNVFRLSFVLTISNHAINQNACAPFSLASAKPTIFESKDNKYWKWLYDVKKYSTSILHSTSTK